MERKINEVLEKIQPFLNSDGGDIEFVKFEDGVCYVRLTGACASCMMSDYTLNNTVEKILKEKVPEIKHVVNLL